MTQQRISDLFDRGELTPYTASVLDANFTELYAGIGGAVFTPEQYGAAIGGVWDVAFQAAFDAMDAAGGGTLVLKAGTYALTNFPTIALTPYNPLSGGTRYKQKPFAIVGAGCLKIPNIYPVAVWGGTILDIRGAQTYGKITTVGDGFLQLRNLTLTDSTASGGALLWTTCTTIGVSDVCFLGAGGTQTTSVQNAIVFGGTNMVFNGFDGNSAFQGYGTVVRENYFHNIKTVATFNGAANSIIFRDNSIWNSCGASDTTPCISIVGLTGSNMVSGSVVEHNLIETSSYQNIISAIYAKDCILTNQYWDPRLPGTAGDGTWLSASGTATYVSATQFTLVGDQAAALLAHPYLKIPVTTITTVNHTGQSTFTGKVSAAVFSSVTTVTVVADPWSPPLNSGVTGQTVQYGDAYTKLIVWLNDYCARITMWGSRTAESDSANLVYCIDSGATQPSDASHNITSNNSSTLVNPLFNSALQGRGARMTDGGRTWQSTGFLNDLPMRIDTNLNGNPIELKTFRMDMLKYNNASLLGSWDFDVNGTSAFNPTIAYGIPYIAAASVPTPTHSTPTVASLFINTSAANALCYRLADGTLKTITAV